MRSWLQFVREMFADSRTRSTRVLILFSLLGILPGIALSARAQDPPPGTIARVEGNDISVDGGATAGGPASGSTLFVANGGVVVVHSGDAQMALLGGGEVQICGPAKFTVLTAGDAITLALNFGRLRVELPAKTALRIFTPTIIATPIDISGGARDVTVGLNLDDSLCVLAAGGALQLEHQFSGEKLIVPQEGEFLLDGGRLQPVAGSAGSCTCAAMQKGAPEPEPVEHAEEVAPVIMPVQPQIAAAPSGAAAGAKASAPTQEEQAETQPNIEFSIAAHANEAHPVAPARNPGRAPSEPPPIVPVYMVTVPPLSFVASFPKAPPDPEVDTMLLVSEAQVLPEWEFTGHVAAPSFAGAMKNALGEVPSPDAPMAGSSGERKGFWAALKSLFVGRGSSEE
jgi:hypothetical protein